MGSHVDGRADLEVVLPRSGESIRWVEHGTLRLWPGGITTSKLRSI